MLLSLLFFEKSRDILTNQVLLDAALSPFSFFVEGDVGVDEVLFEWTELCSGARVEFAEPLVKV